PAVRTRLELSPTWPSLPCDLGSAACPPALSQALDPCGGAVIGPYSVEVQLPSGTLATLLVLPSWLQDAGGEEVRVLHDITVEREAAKSRALLISQIAHELRTPLQHILGFASLARDLRDLPLDDL